MDYTQFFQFASYISGVIIALMIVQIFAKGFDSK